MRVWPVALIFLFVTSFAHAQDSKPREFRDCDKCPVMVEIPTGMAIGKFPITRGEYRVFAEATKLESEGCILRIGKDRAEVAEANWLRPGYEQAGRPPRGVRELAGGDRLRETG